jgi:hypothetical protein
VTGISILAGWISARDALLDQYVFLLNGRFLLELKLCLRLDTVSRMKLLKLALTTFLVVIVTAVAAAGSEAPCLVLLALLAIMASPNSLLPREEKENPDSGAEKDRNSSRGGDGTASSSLRFIRVRHSLLKLWPSSVTPPTPGGRSTERDASDVVVDSSWAGDTVWLFVRM